MDLNTHRYIPVLEDISDEDDQEEDLTLETVSIYPNGECSRTSPGNHSTVRRWRQRSARSDQSVSKYSLPDSSPGLSPLSVTTPAVSGSSCSGPSSAPGKIQWGGGQDSGGTKQTIRRRPFNISSIVEEKKPDKPKVPKTIFDKSSTRKTGSGQSIPVGIAVGRQREAKPEAPESTRNSASGSSRQITHSSESFYSPSSMSIVSSQPSLLLAAHSAPTPLPHPPPLMPPLAPLPLLPTPSHHQYPLPFHPPATPQWTHGLTHQAGYGYPPCYPPDTSYYLYLQQHLLLLHHQHLQMARQIQNSPHRGQDVQINVFEGTKQQTILDKDQQVNINRTAEEDIKTTSFQNYPSISKAANSYISNQLTKDNLSGNGRPELKQTLHDVEIKKYSEENIRKDITVESRKSDDQEIEINIELNNNKSKNKRVNQEFINVDYIEEGSDEISETIQVNTSDESFIDVEGDKTKGVGIESNDSKHGLCLLAESIASIEANKEPPRRKVRYASTDCCDYPANSLQILCDVASVQPKQNIKENPLSTRIERSMSLDSYKPSTDQNLNDVKKDIKEFISKTIKKHKKSELSNMKKSHVAKNGVDDMDAWEIELRIKLAEKQRKYNKINKKLLKIKKLKLKSSKNEDKKINSRNKSGSKKSEKEAKSESTFTETLDKFKNAYLATRTNQDLVKLEKTSQNNLCPSISVESKTSKENREFNNKISHTKTSQNNLCPLICVESKTSQENRDSNDKIISHTKNVKENHGTDRDKKEPEIKKRKLEKFVVAKSNCVKMELKKNIGSDEDFSQYKHKKIRRISKDYENLTKQESIINESCKVNDKNTIINVNTSQSNECIASGDLEGNKTKRKKKKGKNKKKKKEKNKRKKKDRNKNGSEPQIEYDEKDRKTSVSEPHSIHSCTLQSKDLSDGLRIIKRIGSHFYPGRLTEISAPDIYGIVVDKERGNKPHILTQEEVLNEAVLEMKPKSVSELKVGDRVCAFWSNQMNYLHPGTVAGPDSDQSFVIIQLDDGDSRDIHIDQVRLLPENYPFVAPSEDSITGLFGSRKRGAAAQQQAIDEKKATVIDDKKSKKHNKNKTKRKKKKQDTFQWSVSVKEVSESDNEDIKHKSLDLSELPSVDSLVRDDDQDSAFVSSGQREDSEEEEEEVEDDVIRRISVSDKSAITAFLPPQQLLWSWSDEGYKLSPKARKVYHNIIEKDDETMQVGDCAVFLSTGRPDRPYIGQIDSMWQTAGTGMKVRVRWFYHQAEVEGTAVGGGRVEDIKIGGALFSSSHYDENDVQTISHKCQVMRLEEFSKLEQCDRMEDMESNDNYYLAGEYDPVEGTIVFAQGVLGK